MDALIIWLRVHPSDNRRKDPRGHSVPATSGYQIISAANGRWKTHVGIRVGIEQPNDTTVICLADLPVDHDVLEDPGSDATRAVRGHSPPPR